jgi:hypothetical protein
MGRPAATLNRQYLREYLDSLGRDRDHTLVAVAVTEAEDGARGTDRERPLRSISYDAEADEIRVTVGLDGSAELRYLVSAPRSIHVEELDGETVLRVADATRVQTVVRLFDSACGVHGERQRAQPVVEDIGGAAMS